MSCTYCCDADAKCARDRCAVCCSCGRDLAAVVLPSIGDSTLFFNLPANAGLPGRGVLVEWGEGRVSAGLDAGPFVDLPVAGSALPPALPAETHKFLRDLYELLDGCPLGHDGQGRVLTHRSTSTADVVEWINRIHEAKRAISDIAPRCMSCGDTCLTPSAAPCPECRPFGDEQRAPCAHYAPEPAQHGPDCPAWCPERAAVTIEAAPPEDLLDRITPGGCRHTRRNLRPNPHGVPVTTCIDCGDEIP